MQSFLLDSVIIIPYEIEAVYNNDNISNVIIILIFKILINVMAKSVKE